MGEVLTMPGREVSELEHYKKRCRDLSIAFENIDLERKYWRRNAEKMLELLEIAKTLVKSYEGE